MTGFLPDDDNCGWVRPSHRTISSPVPASNRKAILPKRGTVLFLIFLILIIIIILIPIKIKIMITIKMKKINGGIGW